MRPALRSYLRAYRRQGENDLLIGLGPKKFAITDPSPEMERFISGLDGTRSIEQLEREFPDSRAWVAQLEQHNLVDDHDAPTALPRPVADRWSRQINYLRLHEREGWSGYDGQARLAGAKVVVVGTGAGGTTLLRLLAAVGVGRLEAVDFDVFEEANLPTHTYLYEEDAGRPKLDAIGEHLARQNSHLEFVPHHARLESADELAELVSGADFFIQAFDRPYVQAARWTNEAGLRTGVPFASIGVTDYGARVGPMVLPGVTACWSCVGLPDIHFVRYGEGAALMGTTVCMLGGILVNEIVKVLTGYAPSAIAGRSLYIDTADLTFTFNDHHPDPTCSCGAAAQGHESRR